MDGDGIENYYIGEDGTKLELSELEHQWKAVIPLLHNKDYHVCSREDIDTSKTYKVLLKPNLYTYIFRHGLNRKLHEDLTNVVPDNSRYGAIWCIDKKYIRSFIA